MKRHGLLFGAISSLGVLLNASIVRAHCPLCTLGAAAAAGGAAVLGVSNATIGVFIGAFAVSMGWWVARMIKKKFIPYQKQAIIAISYITTILPMLPFLSDLHPLYLPWIGSYGLTFAIDMFFVGTLIGALIVSITPWMSKKITALRHGKMMPYQGITLTLGLLLIIGVIMQILL